MGIFGKLFGSNKLITTDADFGAIESFSIKGERVGWQVNKRFLGAEIEILMEGTKEGINKPQKQILLNALNNETSIRTEAEIALKEEFDNAEIEFISIEKHFILKGISVNDEGFEMHFQEKEGRGYFFNVHFNNNKTTGVSIDS